MPMWNFRARGSEYENEISYFKKYIHTKRAVRGWWGGSVVPHGAFRPWITGLKADSSVHVFRCKDSPLCRYSSIVSPYSSFRAPIFLFRGRRYILPPPKIPTPFITWSEWPTTPSSVSFSLGLPPLGMGALGPFPCSPPRRAWNIDPYWGCRFRIRYTALLSPSYFHLRRFLLPRHGLESALSHPEEKLKTHLICCLARNWPARNFAFSRGGRPFASTWFSLS